MTQCMSVFRGFQIGFKRYKGRLGAWLRDFVLFYDALRGVLRKRIFDLPLSVGELQQEVLACPQAALESCLRPFVCGDDGR